MPLNYRNFLFGLMLTLPFSCSTELSDKCFRTHRIDEIFNEGQWLLSSGNKSTVLNSVIKDGVLVENGEILQPILNEDCSISFTVSRSDISSDSYEMDLFNYTPTDVEYLAFFNEDKTLVFKQNGERQFGGIGSPNHLLQIVHSMLGVRFRKQMHDSLLLRQVDGFDARVFYAHIGDQVLSPSLVVLDENNVLVGLIEEVSDIGYTIDLIADLSKIAKQDSRSSIEKLENKNIESFSLNFGPIQVHIKKVAAPGEEGAFPAYCKIVIIDRVLANLVATEEFFHDQI